MVGKKVLSRVVIDMFSWQKLTPGEARAFVFK
ncbi:hypothetical protein J2S05_001469 [Alkalicoccobacillus murimartini]|uniref:Uncharacterized protein n=1 Tax=Alkalicoccobacillus murimartini TaxID=171685 RepID=A0ABT9YGQ7_9BACI|nr:hypothetical protein [Alkalicoccobacillus murimartini]